MGCVAGGDDGMMVAVCIGGCGVYIHMHIVRNVDADATP